MEGDDPEMERLRSEFRASAYQEYPLTSLGRGAIEAAVRLMEKAFLKGISVSSSATRPVEQPDDRPSATVNYRRPVPPDRQKAIPSGRIDYRTLGIQQKMLASRFRRAIFEEQAPEGIAAVLHPPSFVPAGYYTAQWVLPHDRKKPAGTKAMREFVKHGLAVTFPLAEGWALGWLTEWGLELVDFGDTPLPENRQSSPSRSREAWVSLMSGLEHPALIAARKLEIPGHLIDRKVISDLEALRQTALKRE